MNNSDLNLESKGKSESNDQSPHNTPTLIGKKTKRGTKTKDDQKNKTKKELTIIKKKKGKFNPTYVVPPKNKFKSSALLVSIIDNIIAKHDPLALLRAHRKYIINKVGLNEPALLKQLTFKSSNVYYSSYRPMIMITTKAMTTATTTITPTSTIRPDKENNKSKSKSNANPPKLSQSLFTMSDEIAQLSKKYAKECEREINKTFVNKFVTRRDVGNIDTLRYKCENNYYPSKEVLIEDIIFLFDNIRKSFDVIIPNQYLNDSNVIEMYLKYLSDIFTTFIRNINKHNIEEVYNEDIGQMIEFNKLPRSSLQISSLPVRKDYEIIDNYYHVKPEVTEPKVKTTIESKCLDKCCCDSYSHLGPLDLERGKWESHCIDRESNIECDPTLCGCNKDTCKNQSLLNKTYKQLNKEVEERYSWGIDLFTYRNLLYLFPENYESDTYFKYFIEKILMVALSKLGINGAKISNGCEYIVTNRSLYSTNDINFAKHLLSIYKISLHSRNSIGAAYSKGIGIFCINNEGIKQNELIAPYLGEIYPPWLWFEKQDIIKKKKLDMSLPDFYNILLERMKHDENGYDILMIDPNSKGNFASRMSHSCDPNCNTVLMVSDHKYTIGMFAMKNIDKDEELTFDYNSVTEKEKEFQNAICLCSSFNCRGHYLILSSSMVFTEIITKFHSFLHRNAILVKACSLGNKPLSDKEIDILNQFSIKQSVLSGAPIWLQRWAALILDYVSVEKYLLPIILYKSEKQEKDDIEAKKVKERERELALKKGKDKERDTSRPKRQRNTQNKQVSNYNFISDYLWDKKKYVSSSRANKISIDTSLFLYKDSRTTNIDTSIIENIHTEEAEPIQIEREENNNDNNNIDDDNNDNNQKVTNEEEKPVSEEILMDVEEQPNKEVNGKIEKQIMINQLELKTIQEEDTIAQMPMDNNNNNHGDSNALIQVPLNNDSINNANVNPNELLIQVQQDMKMDLEQFQFDKDITGILDNDNDNGYHINSNILSFESEDFSFLSELNLQLEPGYNKTLFDSIQYQVASITEQRIQNLVITIDKVKHVLSRLKSMECPLKILSEEEVFNYYWKNNNSSIRGLLLEKFIQLQKDKSTNPQLKQAIDIILNKLSYNPIQFISQSISYSKLNAKIKKVLIELSLLIRSLSAIDRDSKEVYYKGLSDMLFLYANTQIHFTTNPSLDRAQLLSESIQIRKRDVDASCLPEKFKDAELDTIIEESHKEYENHYIWGQLVGWFKQTVDKPNASLSAERRGTLSYPELDSFFVKNGNEKVLSYPCGERKLFFEKIEENVSRMWPVGNDWSYKNKHKVYGTVQFDAVYTHKFYLDKIKEYMGKVIGYLSKNEQTNKRMNE